MAEAKAAMTPRQASYRRKPGLQFFDSRFARLDSDLPRNDGGGSPPKSIDKNERLS